MEASDFEADSKLKGGEFQLDLAQQVRTVPGKRYLIRVEDTSLCQAPSSAQPSTNTVLTGGS